MIFNEDDFHAVGEGGFRNQIGNFCFCFEQQQEREKNDEQKPPERDLFIHFVVSNFGP